MSKAEELLDSLSIEDIQPFTSEPDIEGHIVIDKDRIIHVPTELKRIAVQYDSNIETVTFDCPRYWDEHDLSEMNIYINYKLPGNLINNIGQSLVKNLRINEDDENIINFDWTIGPILTNNKGDLPFSVCAKSKTNQDSDEAIRWYTEINTELTISEGMDGSGDIEDNYEDLFPDVINDIISKLEGINATYDEKLEAFNTNATSKTESFDTNAETKTTEFNNNATTKTNEFNSNAIEKTEAFNTNANGVLKKSNAFINGLMNAALTNEVEGVENVINDGIECPLFKMEVDGYTNEQVVTTGKNKFDTSSLINRAQTIGAATGNIYTLKPNTQYTISTNMVSSNTDDSIPIIGIPQSINAFIFVSSDTTIETISSAYNGVGTTNNITRTLMTDDTGNIFVGIRESVSSSLSNLISEGGYVQIEEGSVATEYEPYTGGQPSPSPDYEQPINSIEGSLEFACRGKNLCNGVNQNYYINITGNTAGYAVGNSGLAIDVSEYSQLTISTKENQERYRAACVTSLPKGDSSGVVTAYNGVVKDGTNNAITIDTTNYNYLIINATNLSVIQVEDGSVATKIEPYIQPNEVTFNLNGEKLRSVGDVKDELVVDLSTGDYYKVENITQKILDGSDDENWEYDNKKGDITQWRLYLGNSSYFNDDVVRIISNYFLGYGFNNSWSIDDSVSLVGGNSMRINTSRFDSVESLKQWLSNHNTIINYILKSPTTKKLGTLGADQLLKLATLKGYNYMTVTGIVDGELVNLNSRITYIQNANDYREIQNGKIAKMISNHPKQNMEGIDNTFDDAVDMELFELGGDGKSEQVVTTGKNLLDNTLTSGTINGITYTVNDDKSVTLNGTATSITWLILNKSITLPIGTYTMSQGNQDNNVRMFCSAMSGYVTNGTKTTTLNEEKSSDVSINIPSGETVSNLTIYPMIEQGSQATEYEPYTGGQPSPSPDYPQPINSIEGSLEFACRGKNLFNINNNKEKWIGGETTYTIENGKLTIKGKWYIGFLLDSLKKNTDYYVSYAAKVIKGTNSRVSIYDLDKHFICAITNNTYFNSNNNTAYWILFYTGETVEETNEIEYTDIMVKEKYPINEYEPYVEPNQVIFNLNEEKLRSVGDIKDELVVDLDTGDYYKTENIGEVVFDGSDDENWKLDAITAGTEIRQFNNLIGNVLDKNDEIVRVISNYFKGVIWNLSWTFNNTITAYTYGNLSGVRLQSNKFEDVEQLKQWLSTNNAIVDYVLQKPTTKKLGTLSAEDLAKLKTFKGYNNVTVNTNLGLMNIRFIYGLDVKKYLDNKIAELSAQLIKGE